MEEVCVPDPGAGKLRHRVVAPFAAAAWGSATQTVGDGTLEDTSLVAQCQDTAPVVHGYLREAEKSTTDHAKHRLTWDLLG